MNGAIWASKNAPLDLLRFHPSVTSPQNQKSGPPGVGTGRGAGGPYREENMQLKERGPPGCLFLLPTEFTRPVL